MNVLDFKAVDIDGNLQDLSQYKGKVLLIVNTASKCGFTPQYKGLETLYQKLEDKGLVVLGFPSNQFNSQEPGENDDIKNFCEINYGVSFPMFSKIDVNGPTAHPIYKYLKKELKGFPGSELKWNFTKFLIDSNGNPSKRFSPLTKPEKLRKDIEKLLAKN